MCFFGGGGSYDYTNSPEYRYYEEQNRREQERMLQQQQATNAINTYFDSNLNNRRYAGGYRAMYDTLREDASQQYNDVLNDIKVNLARRGQLGSNVDAAYFAKARRMYDDAVREASRMADNYRARARSQDESLRGQLLGQVYGGLTGDAARSIATSAMSANQHNYVTDAYRASLGNVFSDLAQQLERARVSAGTNQARAAYGDEDDYNTFYNTL